MTIEITMPALSPTMKEGKLAKWHKNEGDEIQSGDVIAEIETDKATMEVEAADEGTLGKILVSDGSENVPVNTVIGILLEEDDDQAALEAAVKAAKDKPAQTQPATESGQQSQNDDSQPDDSQTPDSAPDKTSKRVFASPLARRMADEAGLDLSQITGSGSNGRVVKMDIEKAKETGKAQPVRQSRALAPAKERSQVANTQNGNALAGFGGGPQPSGPAYRDVPHSSMRKTIAKRLTQSKQTVPHYQLTVDCELDELLKMRTELNSKADQLGLSYKLSLNDFIIKAVAMALRKVPAVNVTWHDDFIRMYNTVDVAVAVATPNGLVTPIIRNADRRRLPDISRTTKALAEKARAGKLMPEEYEGGSFTISNLGMFGIKSFTAIINPPQAGIMAVGTSEQRLVIKNGAIAIANQMTCTMSFDHRAVDGAVGADFLSRFKQIIEQPLVLML